MASIYELHEDNDGTYQDTFQYLNGAGNQVISSLAQTFTIGTTGPNEAFVLSSIDLNLEKVGTPSGNLSVQIVETDSSNLPTPSIISEGTIAISGITSKAYYSVTNMNQITLRKGIVYAIVISHASPSATDYIKWHGNDATGGVAYSGGAGYVSTDFGGSWVLDSVDADVVDFNFRVYGDFWGIESVEFEECVFKGGANANATAIGIHYVRNWAKQAVGVVNSLTRFDWESSWNTADTLGDNFKKAVSETISNLVGVKIINYDMTGYNDRLEAEGMKDTLRLEAREWMDELKEDSIKEKMGAS